MQLFLNFLRNHDKSWGIFLRKINIYIHLKYYKYLKRTQRLNKFILWLLWIYDLNYENLLVFFCTNVRSNFLIRFVLTECFRRKCKPLQFLMFWLLLHKVLKFHQPNSILKQEQNKKKIKGKIKRMEFQINLLPKTFFP